jgi:molybdopterin/thiamine biosynthesis adenylyltransferase
MDTKSIGRFKARMARPQFETLMAHLFPGDHDEHGAVLTFGVSESGPGTTLIVRDILLAKDGKDYVPGKYGYRALTADFVARTVKYCAGQKLGYLAVHCHGGDDQVEFSPTDLDSHRRGYPALLDITAGGPVGALVFAANAVAGEIWTPDGTFPLEQMEVVGGSRRRLFPSPQCARKTTGLAQYHRQSLLFGEPGQVQLQGAKIGIIGLGGAGSLLSEWLAHLGVGEIVGVDFDKVEPTNRPRLVGATAWDAQEWLWNSRSAWLRSLGRRLASYKVDVAKRVALTANSKCRYTAIVGDVTERRVARRLKDADYLFLCADSAQSRLVFNALVHQYLIPGVQVGAKVPVDPATGTVGEVFCVSRPVQPHAGGGCLLCNGLIPPSGLQDEAISQAERAAQRYVEDDGVKAPSVITLNALACAQAANDFLFSFLGLQHPNVPPFYLMHFARGRQWKPVQLAATPSCLHCGSSSNSAFGRGDRDDLPCRSHDESE